MTTTAQETIPYQQLRNTLKTGDLLSFEGDGSPLDWAIKFAESGAPYTHVGMVIKDGENLYFWDAPGGGNRFPDPYKGGEAHGGCRVADLDKLLEYYMGEGGETQLFVRQLKAECTPEQQICLRTFIAQANGTPFPGDELTLPKPFNLGAGLFLSVALGNAQERLGMNLTICGSFFCAHLVAESYMRMGLLPIHPWPANSYSPANFNSTDPAKLGPPLQDLLGSTRKVFYP